MINNEQQLSEFKALLHSEEKSEVTIYKYLHDVQMFQDFCGREEVTKELTIRFKDMLKQNAYSPRSINSMLASVNKYLRFLGKESCRVRNLKLQPRPYAPLEKELSRQEYLRLLAAAGKDSRLQLIIETICATGIRVSELKYFTADGVQKGEIEVTCKGKIRVILIPGKLRKKLLAYCSRKNIKDGIIFRTRGGNPVNRSNIWAQMKALCEKARVDRHKVFPHNLRKLFARCFYEIKKDIAKLADVLGHSSIDTTRIYIMETSREHRRVIEKLRLVL
ncbi:MAG: tyrosine-type recombinase/integrase [Lachnospiraceae bacterium]|nr:tyrosine-type recombinase/integrase [Candidatus Hippenecus merdae]